MAATSPLFALDALGGEPLRHFRGAAALDSPGRGAPVVDLLTGCPGHLALALHGGRSLLVLDALPPSAPRSAALSDAELRKLDRFIWQQEVATFSSVLALRLPASRAVHVALLRHGDAAVCPAQLLLLLQDAALMLWEWRGDASAWRFVARGVLPEPPLSQRRASLAPRHVTVAAVCSDERALVWSERVAVTGASGGEEETFVVATAALPALDVAAPAERALSLGAAETVACDAAMEFARAISGRLGVLLIARDVARDRESALYLSFARRALAAVPSSDGSGLFHSFAAHPVTRDLFALDATFALIQLRESADDVGRAAVLPAFKSLVRPAPLELRPHALLAPPPLVALQRARAALCLSHSAAFVALPLVADATSDAGDADGEAPTHVVAAFALALARPTPGRGHRIELLRTSLGATMRGAPLDSWQAVAGAGLGAGFAGRSGCWLLSARSTVPQQLEAVVADGQAASVVAAYELSRPWGEGLARWHARLLVDAGLARRGMPLAARESTAALSLSLSPSAPAPRARKSAARPREAKDAETRRRSGGGGEDGDANDEANEDADEDEAGLRGSAVDSPEAARTLLRLLQSPVLALGSSGAGAAWEGELSRALRDFIDLFEERPPEDREQREVALAARLHRFTSLNLALVPLLRRLASLEPDAVAQTGAQSDSGDLGDEEAAAAALASRSRASTASATALGARSWESLTREDARSAFQQLSRLLGTEALNATNGAAPHSLSYLVYVNDAPPLGSSGPSQPAPAHQPVSTASLAGSRDEADGDDAVSVASSASSGGGSAAATPAANAAAAGSKPQQTATGVGASRADLAGPPERRYPFFELACRLYDLVLPQRLVQFVTLVGELAPGLRVRGSSATSTSSGGGGGGGSGGGAAVSADVSPRPDARKELQLAPLSATGPANRFWERALHCLPPLLPCDGPVSEAERQHRRARVDARASLMMACSRLCEAVQFQLHMAAVEELETGVTAGSGLSYHEEAALRCVAQHTPHLERERPWLRSELWHHFLCHWLNRGARVAWPRALGDLDPRVRALMPAQYSAPALLQVVRQQLQLSADRESELLGALQRMSASPASAMRNVGASPSPAAGTSSRLSPLISREPVLLAPAATARPELPGIVARLAVPFGQLRPLILRLAVAVPFLDVPSWRARAAAAAAAPPASAAAIVDAASISAAAAAQQRLVALESEAAAAGAASQPRYVAQNALAECVALWRGEAAAVQVDAFAVQAAPKLEADAEAWQRVLRHAGAQFEEELERVASPSPPPGTVRAVSGAQLAARHVLLAYAGGGAEPAAVRACYAAAASLAGELALRSLALPLLLPPGGAAASAHTLQVAGEAALETARQWVEGGGECLLVARDADEEAALEQLLPRFFPLEPAPRAPTPAPAPAPAPAAP